MTSITILQAEKAELLKELKAKKEIYKHVGADMQPKFQLVIFALEEQIKDKEAEIRLAQKEIKNETKEEKDGEKEEESEAHKYTSFKSALSVYDDTEMCFHKASTPRYFYKKTYQDLDKKTNLPRPATTELLMFTPASLSENWVELESKTAQKYLKHMVHGKTLFVKEPDKEGVSKFEFERKVYTKLGNTRHTPDPETYNMIDTSDIMKPTGTTDECPPIIRQLLLAMTGNVEIDGVLSKPENLEWFEKWLYGVLAADIGNNMLSMPVLFGSGKVGKNAMFDKIFPRILGTELCFTGLWDNLDGNFTGFKLGKIFIYLDEIPPRDDWNKLKSLTGSPTEYVKVKYGPEFVIENTVALAIGTNNVTFPLPLEDGKQMTRVSPIQTDSRSTFAENTAKYFEAFNPGMMAQVLLEQGVDITNFKDNLYELGDKFLRLNEEYWCSKEQVQGFLNYLHGKFGKATYTLEPLRGKDWDEIVRSKPNPLEQVIEFIVERNPTLITIPELYEIYKVLTGDKVNNQFVKGANNFSTLISPLMKNIGYDKKVRHRVEVQPTAQSAMKQKIVGSSDTVMSQLTVFYKEGTTPGAHKQDMDVYIVEERVHKGDVRRLIWPNNSENVGDSNM